jgi:hypothetical protein
MANRLLKWQIIYKMANRLLNNGKSSNRRKILLSAFVSIQASLHSEIEITPGSSTSMASNHDVVHALAVANNDESQVQAEDMRVIFFAVQNSIVDGHAKPGIFFHLARQMGFKRSTVSRQWATMAARLQTLLNNQPEEEPDIIIKQNGHILFATNQDVFAPAAAVARAAAVAPPPFVEGLAGHAVAHGRYRYVWGSGGDSSCASFDTDEEEQILDELKRGSI